jgi:DNA (cytosine-5)-methyltransferase 1
MRFTSIASFMDARYADRMNLFAEPAALDASAIISRTKSTAMSRRPIGVHLYSGVGGMGLGFEQAGFDVVAAIDIDKKNTETHARNFPSCKTWCADLSQASGKQIREKTSLGERQIDVLFAGPPCQGFSLIGKRASDDPRSALLLDLSRLISELSPSYFVVENVEGVLLGSAKDKLDSFVRNIKSSGYSVVEPIQVLDAAKFGVPQRRRRVFVLGYKNGLTAPSYPLPIFPLKKDGHHEGPTVWDAIGDLPNISDVAYLLKKDSYAGKLGKASHYSEILRGEVKDPEDKSKNRNTNGHGLCGCLRTSHNPETIERFAATKPGSSEAISRYYRLEKNGVSPTLRAGTGPDKGSFMAARPIHPSQNRCITVREAARLHSFPDWFYFHPTKWHGFRQVGNSVPPLLARAVAATIIHAVSRNAKLQEGA